MHSCLRSCTYAEGNSAAWWGTGNSFHPKPTTISMHGLDTVWGSRKNPKKGLFLRFRCTGLKTKTEAEELNTTTTTATTHYHCHHSPLYCSHAGTVERWGSGISGPALSPGPKLSTSSEQPTIEEFGVWSNEDRIATTKSNRSQLITRLT
jgi:hypothetical protein